MSWAESLPRRFLVPALLAGVAAGLAGCVTPLYASRGGTLGADLRAVAVDPVPDRLGHYLRDELVTDLNGTGSRPAPRYRLQLTPAERVPTPLSDITSQRPTNAALLPDVTSMLIPIEGGSPVATGSPPRFASYDRSAQRFANIRAARDAEIRDAKTLADELTTQIAAKIGTLPPAH